MMYKHMMYKHVCVRLLLFDIDGCWCSFLLSALFLGLSSHLTDQNFCNDNWYLTSMVWARKKKNAWSQVKWRATQRCEHWSCYRARFIRTTQGTIGTIMKARKWARLERYVGTIGAIGTACGHDWNDICGAAFKGTMGTITMFVMLEVQIF